MNKNIVSYATFLVGLVLIEYVCAYFAGMLWPSQLSRAGIRQGLPLFFHGGVLSDLTLLNVILVASAVRYSDQWFPLMSQHWLLISTCCASTIVCHVIWSSSDFPDALVGNHRIHLAGIFHAMYMCIALSQLALLYFATKNVDQTFLVWVSVGVCAHILIGTHLVLNIFKPWFWQRNSYVDDPSQIVMVLIVWGLVGFRTWLMLRKH